MLAALLLVPELLLLSLDNCLGGGPDGLVEGKAGASPLAILLLLKIKSH